MTRLLLGVLITVMMGGALWATEEDASGPEKFVVQLFASALEGLADRVEQSDPKDVQAQLASWEAELDWVSDAVDYVELFLPAIKEYSDPLQGQVDRLQQAARDGNLDLIRREKQIFCRQLRGLVALLRGQIHGPDPRRAPLSVTP